ncbi:hypothetical protein J0383_19550 [Flavobacterium endoglycinae]|uniref:Uncharacterized protein n=1 Tax=Flavobacterium endoglycinae TaxID=2816357 RepID=A0ABX7QBW1_9FLAO|nr:hypothetical protein [Flavobacterium endoglycinae]QSW88437.1 hypothetical protein J0383_19550 [Flavobacterium endoglycinae]
MAAGRKTDYTATAALWIVFNKYHFGLFSPDSSGNPSAPGSAQKIEAYSGKSSQKINVDIKLRLK